MSDRDEPTSAQEQSRAPIVDARIVLTARPEGAEDIWSVLVDLATTLQPTEWCLIGGQMVAFRASIAGVSAPRTSDDLDVLSNLYVHPDAVARCARTFRALGFEVEELHTSGHRFTRGRLVVDVLAPDHPPTRAALRTVGRRTTIEVPRAVPRGRSGRPAEDAWRAHQLGPAALPRGRRSSCRRRPSRVARAGPPASARWVRDLATPDRRSLTCSRLPEIVRLTCPGADSDDGGWVAVSAFAERAGLPGAMRSANTHDDDDGDRRHAGETQLRAAGAGRTGLVPRGGH